MNEVSAQAPAESRDGNRPAILPPSSRIPVSVTKPGLHSIETQDEPGRDAPFAQLSSRMGHPLRIAILSDFTRIPYANGAVFQTHALYQELRRCGHQVTIIGPRDPDADAAEIPEGTVELPSLPLLTYPGVHLPLPTDPSVFDPSRWQFDLCFAQTTSLLVELGVWLRKVCGIPLLCVNTTHLSAAYEVLLPDRLAQVPAVHRALHRTLREPMEGMFARIYNESDGLVVLSEGLRDYWRECGVRVPIHVVRRSVNPAVFDAPLGPDPYADLLRSRGLPADASRLLCAGRLTREKCQDRTIRIFAEHIAPACPQSALFVVGDGPERESFQQLARELRVGHRVVFIGEVPFTSMPDFHRHADLFLHTSLSETFGNVLGEALWCGSPTVAFRDGMGASSQIVDDYNGILCDPGSDQQSRRMSDEGFGRTVIGLLSNPGKRAELSGSAARFARSRCAPRVIQQALVDTFVAAKEHAVAQGLRPLAEGSPLGQAWETIRCFRSWMGVMGGLYITGHFRPAKPKASKAVQPKLFAVQRSAA